MSGSTLSPAEIAEKTAEVLSIVHERNGELVARGEQLIPEPDPFRVAVVVANEPQHNLNPGDLADELTRESREPKLARTWAKQPVEYVAQSFNSQYPA